MHLNIHTFNCSDFMIKKILSIVGLALVFTYSSQAQIIQDIFNPSLAVTWLGIDYSYTKIVGSISQFGGKVPVSATELHDKYYGE